eukprot:COSAG06_NODE_6893_length_2727_cov_1.593227_2_plen_235_part_00
MVPHVPHQKAAICYILGLANRSEESTRKYAKRVKEEQKSDDRCKGRGSEETDRTHRRMTAGRWRVVWTKPAGGGSFRQRLSQPSPFTRLPSSHCSTKNLRKNASMREQAINQSARLAYDSVRTVFGLFTSGVLVRDLPRRRHRCNISITTFSCRALHGPSCGVPAGWTSASVGTPTDSQIKRLCAAETQTETSQSVSQSVSPKHWYIFNFVSTYFVSAVWNETFDLNMYRRCCR